MQAPKHIRTLNEIGDKESQIHIQIANTRKSRYIFLSEVETRTMDP